MNDINISELLSALEKLDVIISSDYNSELEKDLAVALKQSLYYINKNGEKYDGKM